MAWLATTASTTERLASAEDLSGSATSSDDSRQHLLAGSEIRDSLDDEKRGRSYHDTDWDETDQAACCIDRWWKLILLLIVSVLFIPLTVRLSLSWKHARHQSASTSHHDWQQPEDAYVLHMGWDFAAPPQVREYDWTVEDVVISPDGVFRPMMVINGRFPGPLIRANEGDTIKVKVTNAAVNATSIHWHGLYQNGTNHMDGTVGITQCPIPTGHSFVYEFKVEAQSGTHWYHGHHGMQASDGLYGPLIIHARNENDLQKIPYRSDRIIMVSDYYHEVSGALLRRYLAPDMENAEPVPDGVTINGRGSRDCATVPDRRCDPHHRAMPSVRLNHNEHHRLRIINTGAFAEVQFQVDEHELSVTEVDGTDVWPKPYHRINILPAQRYSVILSANQSTSDSFWMRARMIPTCFAEPNPYLVADVNAAVRYEGATPSGQPASIDWGEALALECNDLNTTDLIPVETIPAPPATTFHYLRANFEIGPYRLSRGFFNHSSWRPSSRSPTLYQLLSNLTSTFSSLATPSITAPIFDPVTQYTIPSGPSTETIDVLIHSFDDGAHPFHLHGHKFFVLASGHGSPPRLDALRGPEDRANIQPLYDALDTSNPLRRDTVTVEAYGWTLIRFVADNPGLWALHCHVGWHAEAGLMMQFAVKTEELVGLDERVREGRSMCDAEGVERGRGPRDEEFFAEA